MKLVTYNIQYGIGLDGTLRPRPHRRRRARRRHHRAAGGDPQQPAQRRPRHGGRDWRALLPDYFAVYRPSNGGRCRLATWRTAAPSPRTFQFGNMVLSRWPIVRRATCFCRAAAASRRCNLQRGALEALIETPARLRSASIPSISTIAVRSSAPARSAISRSALLPIRSRAARSPASPRSAFRNCPVPKPSSLMGDFNMLPGSPEYVARWPAGPRVRHAADRRSRRRCLLARRRPARRLRQLGRRNAADTPQDEPAASTSPSSHR